MTLSNTLYKKQAVFCCSMNFAFPMLGCLYFHTENTFTYTQHGFEIVGYELFFKTHFFCPTTFHPILRLENNSKERLEFSIFPTWNFCCLKTQRSFYKKLMNCELEVDKCSR